MIKKKGFYGFFVMNQKTGAKLCIGGKVRNIGNITDIRYYEASFEAMINQYIIALLPYRKEVKKEYALSMLDNLQVSQSKMQRCI